MIRLILFNLILLVAFACQNTTNNKEISDYSLQDSLLDSILSLGTDTVEKNAIEISINPDKSILIDGTHFETSDSARQHLAKIYQNLVDADSNKYYYYLRNPALKLKMTHRSPGFTFGEFFELLEKYDCAITHIKEGNNKGLFHSFQSVNNQLNELFWIENFYDAAGYSSGTSQCIHISITNQHIIYNFDTLNSINTLKDLYNLDKEYTKRTFIYLQPQVKISRYLAVLEMIEGYVYSNIIDSIISYPEWYHNLPKDPYKNKYLLDYGKDTFKISSYIINDFVKQCPVCAKNFNNQHYAIDEKLNISIAHQAWPEYQDSKTNFYLLYAYLKAKENGWEKHQELRNQLLEISELIDKIQYYSTGDRERYMQQQKQRYADIENHIHFLTKPYSPSSDSLDKTQQEMKRALQKHYEKEKANFLPNLRKECSQHFKTFANKELYGEAIYQSFLLKIEQNFQRLEQLLLENDRLFWFVNTYHFEAYTIKSSN